MKKRIFKKTISIGCALVLGLLSACSNDKALETISLSDDVFKINVLPGSFTTEDCGMSATEFNMEIKCIAFPIASKLEEGENWKAAYLTELDKAGWKLVMDGGDVFAFEKPKSETCNHRLTIMVRAQGSEDDVLNYVLNGVVGNLENQTYIFMIENNLNCGDKRHAK